MRCPAPARGYLFATAVPPTTYQSCRRRRKLPLGLSERPSTPCLSSYRWSAERDDTGRRKRESLFDNGEPGASLNVEESDVSVRTDSSTNSFPGPTNGYDPSWDVDTAPGVTDGGSSQGAQFSSSSSSSSEASPGLWDEWGQSSPPADQGDAFGWGAPSWGASTSPAGAPQQRDAPSTAQPSSRGERPEGPSQWDLPADHVYGGSRWEAHEEHMRAGRGSEEDGTERPPGAARSGEQGAPGGAGPGFASERGGPGGRYGSERYSSSYEPGASPPDIATLNLDELERVMPVIPFSQQASFFNKGAVESVQRWGASLALTVLLSKVVVLAATSLTWPLWWPWAMAANKNLSLRKQFKYAGLWRTQILEVEFTGRPKPLFGEGPSTAGRGFSTMRMAKFLVGDPDGALTEMTLPYDSRYELVGEGEQAELLVLSNSSGFESFKAVKDVYLPSCGLWLSEYPYADRTAFLEVSLDIEQEALQEEQAAQQDQQGARPGPDGYYTRY